MTVKKKILISVATVITVMLILPILITNFAKAEIGLPLILILFFAVNPITEIALSIMAGTNISKLWWIPLFTAIAFPLLFSLATLELVLDLFVYSAIYLIIGIVAMLITHLIKRVKNK